MILGLIIQSITLILKFSHCKSKVELRFRKDSGLEILIQRCLPLLEPLQYLASKSDDENEDYYEDLTMLVDLLIEIQSMIDEFKEIQSTPAANHDSTLPQNQLKYNCQISHYDNIIIGCYFELNMIHKALRGCSFIKRDIEMIFDVNKDFSTSMRQQTKQQKVSCETIFAHNRDFQLKVLETLKQTIPAYNSNESTPREGNSPGCGYNMNTIHDAQNSLAAIRMNFQNNIFEAVKNGELELIKELRSSAHIDIPSLVDEGSNCLTICYND